jgi:hypothetical protein
VVVLTSLPGRSLTWVPGPEGADKAVHLALYGVLGALAGRAARIGGRPGAMALLVAGALFAALDEAHQAWIPGREVSAADWGFDLLGFALGAAWPRSRAVRGAAQEREGGAGPVRREGRDVPRDVDEEEESGRA